MSERMTEERATDLRKRLRDSSNDTSRTERDAIADDWKRARASEATLEARVKALEEALRTIRGLCRGCLKPMEEHPPGPPCPPFLPGPMRAPGSALFRLVDAALKEPTP